MHGPIESGTPSGRRHRIARRAQAEPVGDERVAEHDVRGLLGRERVVHRSSQHRGDLRMELEPPGVRRPRHLVVGAEHLPSTLALIGGAQRRWDEGGQEARLFDDALLCLVALQRRSRGVEHRAPVAPDEALHRGGEGGVTHRIREVDHPPLEECSQSTVPPPVEGHEPQGTLMMRLPDASFNAIRQRYPTTYPQVSRRRCPPWARSTATATMCLSRCGFSREATHG